MVRARLNTGQNTKKCTGPLFTSLSEVRASHELEDDFNQCVSIAVTKWRHQ